MKRLFYFFMFMCSVTTLSQEIDKDLLKVRERMTDISGFSAEVKMKVDISFINMPEKQGTLHYSRGKPVTFDSDDFIMIPKRGFDFSLDALFSYPFITVDRGEEIRDGRALKHINVIPTDDRADFSIASLLIDTERHRIVESTINTLKEGAFKVEMQYADNEAVLPRNVVVSFEVEKIRIPLNFMGRDTEIDRKSMRQDGPKEGKIFLEFTSYDIEVRP
ncbi:hypothetical protein [Robertkochia aurantiaca]|uniref:hypothetical protein n=1 Tax=Robertkochia aurantiaca TaxID=2873700 RepID=UPI001CCBA605|nr:hypothetical protein [Robertkochia sp. 3YJGBD-33]